MAHHTIVNFIAWFCHSVCRTYKSAITFVNVYLNNDIVTPSQWWYKSSYYEHSTTIYQLYTIILSLNITGVYWCILHIIKNIKTLKKIYLQNACITWMTYKGQGCINSVVRRESFTDKEEIINVNYI